MLMTGGTAVDQQRHEGQYQAQERNVRQHERDRDQAEDPARSRERNRESHLTQREREERWPIG
jgi:hypothetical protein